MKVEAEHVDLASDSSSSDIAHKGHGQSRVFEVASQGQAAPDDVKSMAMLVYDSLAGVHSYRWDPRFLALPVTEDRNRRFRMEASGFGLALCLDHILGFDRELFNRLEQRFRTIFPHIKSIKLIPEQAFKSPVDDPEQVPLLQRSDGKGLYFEFAAGGEPIPARQVSDGVLLVLAYLTTMYLPQPPQLMLVEEPENGIHPGRLKDVLSILRELVSEQSQTQIVLTTHSPYVVDLFQPDEVTLCQMEGDGSVSVRRLSESKTVRDQLDVFTLGEIWTAEGDEVLAQSAISAGESSK
jgi:predicted ATPase